MPTKRVFDLTLLTILLAKPAFGLVKMASRRWSSETSGPLQVVGDAVGIAVS